MAKRRQFKTESQKLLDLMINSIYTHKEIFLRELISNASDAIDKRHFIALTDPDKGTDYEIFIEMNKDKRQLIIKDNGIGLTEEELISNIGTIARSGSQEFKDMNEQNEMDIIGQFGVGFYSAFMVSKRVTVITKALESDVAYKWISTGINTYTIDETEKDEIGTTIILDLRENNDELEETYDEFLSEYEIRQLVKKYSDYIRYPIKMEVTKYQPKTDKEEATEYHEIETLNSMIPIWQKNKSEVTQDELNEFYKNKFYDYTDPLRVIHTKVEGLTTYTALLFIPKKPPFDFYTEKYEKGLQLYSKGVFIMDKNKELIGDHFRFIRGLVDSADLSLNISREMLQHDRQLKKIAQSLEKKIKSELLKMLEGERELYNEFYSNFGLNLKYGVYAEWGAKKELLQDLIMFKTSKSDDYITLKEYLERKTEEQEFVYYASGKTKEQILSLPQMDLIKSKDYEVLLFTDDVDEFMVNVLTEYDGVKFKSINQGDLGLLDESSKEEVEKINKENKNLLKELNKILKDKVSSVKLSERLTDSAVCLTSEEGLSLEMEKVMKNIPTNQEVKANKILEINPKHDIFKALETMYEKDKKSLDKYAKLLYSQALLIEGFQLEDPVEFSNLMVELMVKSSK